MTPAQFRTTARLIMPLLVIMAVYACKKTDPTQPVPARADLLVATNWRMERITDTTGTAIAVNRLGISALALTVADIQFTDRNVARAIDRTTKQIINGGTWYLVQNNAALDINVTGFVGIFPIISLSSTRLIIRQTTTVDSKKTAVNLEFVPAV